MIDTLVPPPKRGEVPKARQDRAAEVAGGIHMTVADLIHRCQHWATAIPRDLRYTLMVLLVTLWAVESLRPVGEVHSIHDRILGVLADPASGDQGQSL